MGNYGIKVSKAGYDVLSASDDQLVMSSKFNMLKTSAVGTISGSGNYAHGLSYTPAHFAITKQVGTYTRYSAVWGSQNVGADGTNINNGSSNDVRYYVFYQQAI